MCKIKVDAARFRDLTLAAVRALEEAITDVDIDSSTLDDLHQIVEEWHPEELTRMHFANTYFEVVHDSDPKA